MTGGYAKTQMSEEVLTSKCDVGGW